MDHTYIYIYSYYYIIALIIVHSDLKCKNCYDQNVNMQKLKKKTYCAMYHSPLQIADSTTYCDKTNII